jgi:hypothetical protein
LNLIVNIFSLLILPFGTIGRRASGVDDRELGESNKNETSTKEKLLREGRKV